MDEVKVRKLGGVLSVDIPSDLAVFYKLEEGDALKVAREEQGFRLQPKKDRLNRQIDVARMLMDENAEALELLAR